MNRPKLVMLLAGLTAVVFASCDSATTTQASSKTPIANECGTYSGTGCAPLSKRVDLKAPTFSDPTNITNPLFPVGVVNSAVLLGHVEGKPFRTETTVLPGSRTIRWNGEPVRTLTSQYVAYLDRKIEEVALDSYAQADDGSVWYFGEQVVDYNHDTGTIDTNEGTWVAGREGPAAMIMPAHPTVGDAFRTENVLGIVFEEVTVVKTNQTFVGPRGPVHGGIVGRELHLDRTTENKQFAPGYGEFRTSGGGDLEALALAVPTDARKGALPADLRTLQTGASGMLGSVRAEDWGAADVTLTRMQDAWNSVSGGQPKMIADRLTAGMKSLADAVRAKKGDAATQAAVDVALSALDLNLQYQSPVAINADRFELRCQQLLVDAKAKRLNDVTGDVAALEWINDRVSNAMGPAGRVEIRSALSDLRGAADAKNLPAAADQAARLMHHMRYLIAS